METTEAKRVAPQALAGCEGFGVYGPAARIGTVEAIQADAESGLPRLLLVRAGLLGSWLVHVPVDQVEGVRYGERRIALRPGGLPAGPRRGQECP
jgi:hypothetical protein